jgi:hypothetical protein
MVTASKINDLQQLANRLAPTRMTANKGRSMMCDFHEAKELAWERVEFQGRNSADDHIGRFRHPPKQGGEG